MHANGYLLPHSCPHRRQPKPQKGQGPSGSSHFPWTGSRVRPANTYFTKRRKGKEAIRFRPLRTERMTIPQPGNECGMKVAMSHDKRKEDMMFEVLVTCRPDFREEVVERCSALEEAQAVAERLSTQSPDRFVRVWIRRALRTSCNA